MFSVYYSFIILERVIPQGGEKLLCGSLAHGWSETFIGDLKHQIAPLGITAKEVLGHRAIVMHDV